MPNVVYSMSVSLDGYVAGPDGTFDWGDPDDELHRFHNARVRGLGGHLLGRRLYETMRFWDTPEALEGGEVMREFAELWRPLPKVVLSRTLDAVGGGARLATGDLADEIAALKAATSGDIGIGGATLGSSALAAGLVDEVEVFVCPVILGGGTSFFPAGGAQIELDLVRTRTFASRVVHQHYRVRHVTAAP